MAWGGATSGTNAANYVLVSNECNIVVLRDEYIPVGYNSTTYKLDDDGNRVTDDNGDDVMVTQFHQTGTVNVRCRVKETVTVEEWRGLAEVATSVVQGLCSDNRTYGRWTHNGCYCEVPCCIGTVVRASARRSNDAGGWTLTKTTTVTEAV